MQRFLTTRWLTAGWPSGDLLTCRLCNTLSQLRNCRIRRFRSAMRQKRRAAMPREFEGDLTEAVFWGADMRGARFRDVNLTGARISHSFVVDVDIDAFVDKLV